MVTDMVFKICKQCIFLVFFVHPLLKENKAPVVEDDQTANILSATPKISLCNKKDNAKWAV